MKKSNITRISKRPNLFTEPNLAIPLNRSVPSLAEFLESSSVNVHLRDLAHEFRDGPPPDPNFKLRDNAKAPNKKLAHLLDTSSDINKRKNHTTVDVVEAGSRETPINSPQIPSEDLRKRAQVRRLGAVDNFKGADFLKSREFSRFAVSQVLGKNNHKSYVHEKETKTSHDPHIVTEPHSNQDSEPTIVKNPMKKVARLLTQEDRKPELSRVSHSKKAGLRRSKGAFNETSVGERTELSLSRVKRPKQYHPYESQSVLHSAGSPIFNASNNTKLFKDKAMAHERIPTSPEYPETSSSFQLAGHGSLLSKIAEKEKEKRKKTYSTSTSNVLEAKTSSNAATGTKGFPYHHRKGVSGISGISGLPTKPQSETDREMMLRASVEQPSVTYHQSPDIKSGQMSVSGYDMLLSEPVRYALNSKKGSGPLLDVREKPKGAEGKGGKSESLVDSESFARLETAFGLFLEENLKKLSKTQDQYGLERIIKAWNAFTEALAVSHKEGKGRVATAHKEKTGSENLVKSRISTEPERKLSRKRDNERFFGEHLNSRVSTSPGHSQAQSQAQSQGPKGKRVFSKEHNSPLRRQTSVEQTLFQEGLQELVVQQQNTIKMLKRDQEKLMGLILDIRHHGFDVEKVYLEGVSKSGDDFLQYYEHPHMFGPENEGVAFGEHSMQSESRSSVPNLMNISIPDCHDLGAINNYSDAKSTTDSTPFPSGDTMSHNKLNPLLKNKLKLDFRELNPEEKEKLQANAHGLGKLNLNAIRNDKQGETIEPQGFHEEFMSKIGEFSLSWRQAAMNQRNF